jgi:hypothetical protein
MEGGSNTVGGGQGYKTNKKNLNNERFFFLKNKSRADTTTRLPHQMIMSPKKSTKEMTK